MKKSFGIYALIWTIALALFNLVVFLVRPIIPGYVIQYDARFWIAWAFILASFIGNFHIACFAFKADNLKKLFYNISVITVSYTAVAIMLIVGVILMLIPDLPSWICAIIGISVFALHAVAVITATASAGIVSDIDEKVKTQTFFVKNLAADAQILMTSAKSDELRTEAKKVYEAIRYSDPLSITALSELNNRIERQFNAFAESVKTDDAGLAKETADTLIEMIEKRNLQCKLLK